MYGKLDRGNNFGGIQMTTELEKLVQMIQTSHRMVFFGGAGISTASGIPDFRSSTGLYQTESKEAYPAEVMLSHSFFMQHTEEFYRFYREKMLFPKAKPNAAHQALAELEKRGKLAAVVTQNIDGLHQMAGSQKVYEIHGSVHRNYCQSCRAFYDLSYILKTQSIPYCEKCGDIVKPDVVLYEEALDDQTVKKAIDAIQNADLLIIGGTSLVVYPAASFIHYFTGNSIVLMNKGQTAMDQQADIVIRDSIDKAFEQIMQKL